MTKQNLLDLAERVEAGDIPYVEVVSVLFPTGEKHRYGAEVSCGFVKQALHGSLDAAKSLHEVVLTGWVFDITEYPIAWDNTRYCVEVSKWYGKNKIDGQASGLSETNPAAAWVAAILRAKAGEI